MIVSNL